MPKWDFDKVACWVAASEKSFIEILFRNSLIIVADESNSSFVIKNRNGNYI